MAIYYLSKSLGIVTKLGTVKLGNKERFEKEKIGNKEPFIRGQFAIYSIRIRNFWH